MNVLVTAGNTQVPIDRVRCITNVFTGRTGAQIALEAQRRGHHVTLLTSHPEVVADLSATPPAERWAVLPYRTFDDLQRLLEELIPLGGLSAVIHSAAVSDYLAGGIYAPGEGTSFRMEQEGGQWVTEDGRPATMRDRGAGKVKSGEPELWLRMVRAPKLIDRVRREWGFDGVLVKFKLEAGIRDQQLLEIAERSREHSKADLIVANTVEGAGAYAYIGAGPGRYQCIVRSELAQRLMDTVEVLHLGRMRG
jgi:phosphopantothenoylcysteine synthetase/decarboxylase